MSNFSKKWVMYRQCTYTLFSGGDILGYKCSQCGKISRFPDFCCGRATVREGAFYCKTCGNSSSIEQECCDSTMVKA
jgi:hypothetical protein